VLFAQQKVAQNLSLKDAIAFAKVNNPAYLNSRLDQKLAEKKVNEVTAIGLPQINGSVQLVHNAEIATTALPDFISPAVYGNLIKYNLIDPNTNPAPEASIFPVKFGVKNSVNASLSASQLIFDGTFFLGVKAAKEFVQLSKLGVYQTELELETNITKTYYLVLLTKSNLEMVDNNIKTLEKTFSDLTQIFKAGFADRIDADRLELSLSNAKIQRDKLSDQLEIVKKMLKLQMGANVNDEYVLTDNIESLAKDNTNAMDLTNQDYNKRIEYKIIEQQGTLLSYDRLRYQVGYLPSLVAFGSVSRNSFGQEIGNLGDQWYSGAMIGLTLSVPVFDGFRKHFQSQQVKINQSKLDNGKRMLVNSIEMERYSAKTKYLRAKELLGLQKKNMELAESIYKRANLKFKEGLASSLDLVSSETELKAAQTNYLNSIYEVLVSEVEFKKAVGY